MRKPRQFFLLIVMAGAVISGCSLPQPTASPLVVTSPLGLQSQSPLPTASALPEGPLFTISLPVKAGDMVVRGTGGPGVPLRVVNLTQMASELGQGKVGPDGNYEIQLAKSLPAGEQVGLMLGDLAGTSFRTEQFLHGPGYRDVPFIGIVFTTTLVP